MTITVRAQGQKSRHVTGAIAEITSYQQARDRSWLLKPQGPLPVPHTPKATPSSPFQTVHQLGTKHSKVLAYGSHSHSNHHRVKNIKVLFILLYSHNFF